MKKVLVISLTINFAVILLVVVFFAVYYRPESKDDGSSRVYGSYCFEESYVNGGELTEDMLKELEKKVGRYFIFSKEKINFYSGVVPAEFKYTMSGEEFSFDGTINSGYFPFDKGHLNTGTYYYPTSIIVISADIDLNGKNCLVSFRYLKVN